MRSRFVATSEERLVVVEARGGRERPRAPRPRSGPSRTLARRSKSSPASAALDRDRGLDMAAPACGRGSWPLRKSGSWWSRRAGDASGRELRGLEVVLRERSQDARNLRPPLPPLTAIEALIWPRPHAVEVRGHFGRAARGGRGARGTRAAESSEASKWSFANA